jgi:hypothetical protein
MKHLKRFDEDIRQDMTELCDDYLPFLKDNGFTFYINTNPSQRYIGIVKRVPEGRDRENGWTNRFYWKDVKDDVIPFLNILNNKYKINDIVLTDYEPYNGSYHQVFFLDALLNDDIPNESSCISIHIDVT